MLRRGTGQCCREEERFRNHPFLQDLGSLLLAPAASGVCLWDLVRRCRLRGAALSFAALCASLRPWYFFLPLSEGCWCQ